MTPERLERIKEMAAVGDSVTSPIAFELVEEMQRLELQSKELQKKLTWTVQQFELAEHMKDVYSNLAEKRQEIIDKTNRLIDSMKNLLERAKKIIYDAHAESLLVNGGVDEMVREGKEADLLNEIDAVLKPEVKRKCAHSGPAELLCEREEGHDGPHMGDCSKAYPNQKRSH